MRLLRIVSGVAVPMCLVLALSGCDKAAAPGPSVSAPAAPPAAAADSSPLPGIDPRAADAAGSGVPGPGAGQTAVGGMAGSQESGGAKKSMGAAPAPTGGDGAASGAR